MNKSPSVRRCASRHSSPSSYFARKYYGTLRICSHLPIFSRLTFQYCSIITLSLGLVGSQYQFYQLVLGKYFILRFSLLVVDMDQTPQSSTLHRLRNVHEMSNRTTPAESQSKQSETEWKTPNKGGYPEHSPRSNAMKWLKSEEAFLTKNSLLLKIIHFTPQQLPALRPPRSRRPRTAPRGPPSTPPRKRDHLGNSVEEANQ